MTVLATSMVNIDMCGLIPQEDGNHCKSHADLQDRMTSMKPLITKRAVGLRGNV